ncbi:MAG: DUF4332 domain-containing protein [FCB group bacterium]|nr:DUF4332 domain-containing protein [FCB group bacterium]MBL7029078.1 DUF4332 domain-containing protein [Candidatus Neomarinimicrobiota bacterium]MBL7122558.1 DUF4332 domain-containing protein [Candidatus Neomarinimicrobiota bacterium]
MVAQYYIDPKKYSLEKFRISLESRELIPSRQILKNNLKQYFDILASSGIKNISELLAVLGSKPKIAEFAEKTGLSVEYLTILRREANSYFPTHVKLSRFIGVDKALVLKLEEQGITSTKKLFDLASNREQLSAFLKISGLLREDLSQLISLSDLSRLYGVGPAFAGILYEAGMDSVVTLMKYTGEEIRLMYEEKTQRTADFTSRDIDFTLEIARELESVK